MSDYHHQLLTLASFHGHKKEDQKAVVDLKFPKNCTKFWRELTSRYPEFLVCRSQWLAFKKKYLVRSHSIKSSGIQKSHTPPSASDFEADLHQRWSLLLKCMNVNSPSKTSAIKVDGCFVVPGDRFQELYYWDSYFTSKGLLRSGYHEVVRSLILIFVGLMQKYGFVPNGCRTYLTSRSQPPYLTELVYLYLADGVHHTSSVPKKVQAIAKELPGHNMVRPLFLEIFQNIRGSPHKKFILKAVLPSLRREYDWWHTHRRVDQTYLWRYDSTLRSPRPESYGHDLDLCFKAFGKPFDPHNQEMADLFQNIGGVCESGWDFSSRWLKDKDDKASLHINSMIPTDLNAIGVRMLLFLVAASVCAKQDYKVYLTHLLLKIQDIQDYLWHDTLNRWVDFHGTSREPDVTYASDFSPMVAGLLDKSKVLALCSGFRDSQLLGPCGVMASNFKSGEQWDAPNCWPPCQDILVSGLRTYADVQEAADLAREIAVNFGTAAYHGWVDHKQMHEKYHVDQKGQSGQGGEYESQVGFGWTNGVVLHFLHQYRQEFGSTFLLYD